MSVFGSGPITTNSLFGTTAYYQEQEEFKRDVLDKSYVAPSAMEAFFEE